MATNLKQIEQVLIDGKLEKAIEQLLTYGSNRDQDLYNQIIVLSERCNTLKRSIHSNTITHEHAQVERAKIFPITAAESVGVIKESSCIVLGISMVSKFISCASVSNDVTNSEAIKIYKINL